MLGIYLAGVVAAGELGGSHEGHSGGGGLPAGGPGEGGRNGVVEPAGDADVQRRIAGDRVPHPPGDAVDAAVVGDGGDPAGDAPAELVGADAGEPGGRTRAYRGARARRYRDRGVRRRRDDWARGGGRGEVEPGTLVAVRAGLLGDLGSDPDHLLHAPRRRGLRAVAVAGLLGSAAGRGAGRSAVVLLPRHHAGVRAPADGAGHSGGRLLHQAQGQVWGVPSVLGRRGRSSCTRWPARRGRGWRST